MQRLWKLGFALLAVCGLGMVATSGVAQARSNTRSTLPAVVRISPSTGTVNGGTVVLVRGRNFVNALTVSFGPVTCYPAGVVACPFSWKNANEIEVTSPAGTGTVAIRVTNSAGTSATTPADEFTYTDLPAVQSVSPRVGSIAGGNTVTIIGSGFTDASAVDFGSVAATGFVVDGDNTITATSPAEPVGTVDVTVTAPGGSSAADPPADEYTFSNQVPVVASVAPDFGLSSGGATVTITGRGFSQVSAVDFGTTPAASYTVENNTTISAQSPSGTDGSVVEVTVTAAKGTSAGNAPMDSFYYFSSIS